MISFPNAKINIGLHVIARRDDGYHDLETVFYPVKINDVLEIIEAPELSFTSAGIDITGAAGDNLCLKAYRMLAADFDLPPVSIHLYKNIPIGAGLGGGSSDASFTIKLINSKFSLGLSDGVMEDYASRLGADCPFFIRNKPLIASGRGNIFRETEVTLDGYFIVLVMPPVHVSTADAFKNIRPFHPLIPIDDIVSRPVERWRDQVKNDFERTVIPQYPVIGDIKRRLYQAGAIYSSMTGSGAAVYGIFNDTIKIPALELENRVFYGV